MKFKHIPPRQEAIISFSTPGHDRNSWVLEGSWNPLACVCKAKSPGLVWAVWWGSNTQSVPLDTIFSSAGKKGFNSMGFRCILAGALGFQTESVVPAPRPRTAQGVWAVAFFPWQVGTHSPLPVAVHPPRICRWELQSSRTCEWLKTRSLDLRNHCS